MEHVARTIKLMKVPKSVLEGLGKGSSVGRPPIYPWAEMKVGECFEVDAKKQSQVLSNARRYAERNSTGALFASRKTDRGTVLIIRRE